MSSGLPKTFLRNAANVHFPFSLQQRSCATLTHSFWQIATQFCFFILAQLSRSTTAWMMKTSLFGRFLRYAHTLLLKRKQPKSHIARSFSLYCQQRHHNQLNCHSRTRRTSPLLTIPLRWCWPPHSRLCRPASATMLVQYLLINREQSPP